MRRVFIAIAAGIALADASIVTLGLPSILVELNATVEGVALVLGVYTAVLALALLPAAWLCRRFGDAYVGAAGFALFLVASLGCGASTRSGCCSCCAESRRSAERAGLVAAFALLDGGRPGTGRRLWVAASVFGIAIGPALGGALTQAFSGGRSSSPRRRSFSRACWSPCRLRGPSLRTSPSATTAALLSVPVASRRSPWGCSRRR